MIFVKRVSPGSGTSGRLGPLELLVVEGLKFEVDVGSVRQ